MRRFFADLALGFRLALSGGRRGWVRTAMAAAGVAIGATVLLFGASVPVMLDERVQRMQARADNAPEVPSGPTVVVAAVESQHRENAIRGRLIWPETSDAPLPPGVPAFPGDQQMYASPALQKVLSGPDGETLRRQMPYQVIGTIEPAGLSGPHELAYYAGYQRVMELIDSGSWRVDGFGQPTVDEAPDTSTYLALVLLLGTLLLPIAIFIGAALRFGADARDRRLAALRLVGADSRAVLRIALGESLVPAVLGLAAGGVLYLLVRSRAADFRLFDVSVFPADIRPVPWLAALVVVTILALAAGVTLLGFRGLRVEPLGVFRRSATWNGLLWWRLVPVAFSLVLLAPVVLSSGAVDEELTGLGVILLVLALIPLLPYLVPLAARLISGGPVSWQLASQQLRQNPAASTRAVTGIVVAVTGAIALQSFFAAASVHRETPGNPADPAFTLQAPGRQTVVEMRARSERFEQISGVRAGTISKYPLYEADVSAGLGYLIVGDCVALNQIATLDRCADGDVFVHGQLDRQVTVEDGPEVVLPRTVRPATLVGTDAQNINRGVLMTPAAAPAALARAEPWFVETRLFTDRDPAEVAGLLRGITAEIDPLAQLTAHAPEADKFATLRTALDIGATIILLMMSAGLLLDVAARLHDRRRLLGVLAAVGARRSTVAWSVLLQAIVPLLAGLALAALTGAGLGTVLMRASQIPVRFDPGAVLGPVALGAVAVLATTVAVLLPAVRRITTTEELRYE